MDALRRERPEVLEEKEGTNEVLKERRSPRERGRTGTGEEASGLANLFGACETKTFSFNFA